MFHGVPRLLLSLRPRQVRKWAGVPPRRPEASHHKEGDIPKTEGANSMRPQPLIAVRNVRASSRWYQRLLKCKSGMPGPKNHPHRDVYERLVRDGTLLLQLHAWDTDEHPNLGDPNAGPHGHGVVLWFETSEFDETVKRARKMGAEIIEEPHFNIIHMECWIRDPDGYVLALASPDEEEVEEDME